MTNRDASRRPFHTDNQPTDHAAPAASYQAQCDKLPRPAIIHGLWFAEFQVNDLQMSFGLYEKALDFYDEYVAANRHNEARIFMRLVKDSDSAAHVARSKALIDRTRR